MLSKSIREFKACSYCGYFSNKEYVLNKQNQLSGIRYEVKYYDFNNQIQISKPIFCPTSYISEYNKIDSTPDNSLVMSYSEVRDTNNFHIKLELVDNTPQGV